MLDRTLTAWSALDWRLVFGLAASVLGLALIGASARDLQLAAGPGLREPAWPSSIEEPAAGTVALSFAFTARRDLAARVRDRSTPNRPHGDRDVVEASIPRHRMRDGTDSCRELLVLATLQRRLPRERPPGHYATPAPTPVPMCDAGMSTGQSQPSSNTDAIANPPPLSRPARAVEVFADDGHGLRLDPPWSRPGPRQTLTEMAAAQHLGPWTSAWP